MDHVVDRSQLTLIERRELTDPERSDDVGGGVAEAPIEQRVHGEPRLADLDECGGRCAYRAVGERTAPREALDHRITEADDPGTELDDRNAGVAHDLPAPRPGECAGDGGSERGEMGERHDQLRRVTVEPVDEIVDELLQHVRTATPRARDRAGSVRCQ